MTEEELDRIAAKVAIILENKKADPKDESTWDSKELLIPLSKVPDKATKVNLLMKWVRESDNITERKMLSSLVKDYLED